MPGSGEEPGYPGISLKGGMRVAKVIQTPPVDKLVDGTGENMAAGTVENPVETVDKAAERRKIHRRRIRALRSFLFRIVALVAVIYVLFWHIVGITMMPNKDMYPRLDAGDLLLYYRLEKNIKSQDIIVFDKEATAGEGAKTLVCRVIGAPGDTVEVTEEKGLTVNGNTLIESNIFYPTKPYEEGIAEYPVKLGEGEYFVMADQRNGGMDSRYFGIVKADEIRGVVITVLRRNNL